jgi:hypothetical protein
MKPLLEILIPTFNRSESAEAAIESVLGCNDKRLTVRCNSNGYEPNLEKFRNFDSRVKYDCFEYNRGPHANGAKLYDETTAKFCMILSDEDRVNNMNYENILNFLENICKNTQVIACSVFDKSTNDYFWKPSSRIEEFNIHSYVALSPLSTYMSGLIFRVETLKALDINIFCNTSIGNSYSHLDMTLHMLLNGKLRFFHERFVEKGENLQYGGHGHSHKLKNSSLNLIDDKNLDLNMSVYGPNARTRQFYYRENLLNKLKDNIGFVSLFIGKLNYLEFHFKTIMNSHNVVLLTKNITLKDEVLAGYNDSKIHGEFSGTLISYLFLTLLSLPKIISNLLFRCIATFNRLMRKIYVFCMIFSKKITS